MADIRHIKQISIRYYLAERSLYPTKDNPRYGLYLSPLREEHTPSFKVDYEQNLWYDFGLGEGGSIIDLVMCMELCDAGEAIQRLERHIDGMSVSTFLRKNPVPKRSSSIIVEKVRLLENSALLDYLAERGIDLDTARVHCLEVDYRVADKSYFAVGFRNDTGGWELRSPQFKGSSAPKSITTFDRHGDTALLFEGFFDLLSYLTLQHKPTPAVDTAVLNSVVNLPRALPFLARHATIHTFLDNDEAGRLTLERLRSALPGATVIDRAESYRTHKDLNESLRPSAKISRTPRRRGRKL